MKINWPKMILRLRAKLNELLGDYYYELKLYS